MTKETLFTYQTRLDLDAESEAILNQFAAIFGKVERSLFAEVSKGFHPNKLKNEFLKKFQITARHFNAVRVQLQGKIESIQQLRKQCITSLQETIQIASKKIGKLTKKKDKPLLHQKKRRLSRLENKLAKMKIAQQEGKVSLCFGSKKLFRAQFTLEENKFDSHQDWKNTWERARNSLIFLLGSKDETGGNQSCVAKLEESGTLTLRLRLPNSMIAYGKYLVLKNITFNYGMQEILKALTCKQAISYRFVKDEKGWRVFASCVYQKPKTISDQRLGCIGVDINVDHLALAETDRFGNIIGNASIPFNTYGKSKNQAMAQIGDASAKLIEFAKSAKKPIVLEKLNFQKKKSSLKDLGFAKSSRMLSSFSYQKIIQTCTAKAIRSGVEVFTVNPAYTSIIGYVKFSNRYGLTKHQAAAVSIARRHSGFSECCNLSTVTLADGKDDTLTCLLPVRNRKQHVWSFWSQAKKRIQTALAAHFRARYSRSKDPP